MQQQNKKPYTTELCVSAKQLLHQRLSITAYGSK